MTPLTSRKEDGAEPDCACIDVAYDLLEIIQRVLLPVQRDVTAALRTMRSRRALLEPTKTTCQENCAV